MPAVSEHVSHALIAEDDDDDFEIFSAAVDEVSIAIVLTRAENGKILMKKLNDETLPDILFLDILMPFIDGRECLKQIRSNKKYDTLPIIMFSGLTDKNAIDYCFREGSNFFIIKPSNLKELVIALEKIFTIDWKNLYYPPVSQFILPTNPA